MKICSVADCTKHVKGRTMCSAHYERWRKKAQPAEKQRSLPPVERFWGHVKKTTTCWLWTASTNYNGYGRYHIDQKGIYAHRFSYELLHGKIAPELQIDHLCKVRTCVNPDHLEAVTPAENVSRSVSANRAKTHCKYGHEFNEENTYVYGTARKCKRCNVLRQRQIRRLAYA